MVRPGLPSFVLTAIVAFATCAIAVQAPAQDAPATPSKVKIVPPPKPPGPFGTSESNPPTMSLLQFRTPEEMTEQDRQFAADAESSIAEHAGLNGFELEQGSWTYQQIVCQAFPDHLFLQYRRNNGVGDLTVFSASVPRNNEGRVRIVPILKRGYSLFSPAPINALTISAFNHIRAEEPDQGNGSWVGNALCYAALAGAHPKIPSPEDEPSINKPVPALTALLKINGDGSEIIRFDDEAGKPHPTQWTMIFSRKGRLVKATHTAAPMFSVKPVPAATGATAERIVPQS